MNIGHLIHPLSHFQGWHIDYEDERPADAYPDKDRALQQFLTQFADALHAKGMELVIDTASWSGLLSNFSNIAASGVDELQDMSFYDMGDDPSGYKSALATYFAGVKAGNPTDVVTKLVLPRS